MVKFVSYQGEYPRYCDGVLTLEINGKTVVFGDDIDANYDKFWDSGGEAEEDKGGGYHIYRRPWIIHKEKLPQEYQDLSEKIEQTINQNLKWGCCGGCLKRPKTNKK